MNPDGSGAPPLALTMGEPGGIGPDVTLLAWLRRAELRVPPFYYLADPAMLSARADLLGIEAPIAEVSPDEAAARFADALPVVKLEAAVDAVPGRADPRNATAVIEAIARAVGDIRSGSAAAIVTNPINKKALYDAGFRHPGHTEFLGDPLGRMDRRSGETSDDARRAAPQNRPGHDPPAASRGGGGAERATDRRDGPRGRRRSQAPLRHPRATDCGRCAQPACRRRRRPRRRG